MTVEEDELLFVPAGDAHFGKLGRVPPLLHLGYDRDRLACFSEFLKFFAVGFVHRESGNLGLSLETTQIRISPDARAGPPMNVNTRINSDETDRAF